jgi:4,5-DOPA dioxygenase extradiol
VLDVRRGYDHGMFVPLKLMYPDASIPVIQLSLLSSLDAAKHIALGQLLVSLMKRNILVLGSGMSFHNLRAFFVPGLVSEEDNTVFESWLQDTCGGDMEEGERIRRLSDWHQSPGGMKCHPRPEHLLPLHVCYGLAGTKAEVVFDGTVMGRHVTGLLWQ